MQMYRGPFLTYSVHARGPGDNLYVWSVHPAATHTEYGHGNFRTLICRELRAILILRLWFTPRLLVV